MESLIKNTVKMMLIVMPISMTAQNETSSFDEFRKSILNGYNSYRSEILSRYSRYLDSLWVEYPQYSGVVRNPFPKPKDIPVVEGTDSKPISKVPSTPDKSPDVDGTLTQPQNNPLPQEKDKIAISFYGIPLSMSDVNYEIPDNISRATTSSLWDYMYSDDFVRPVIKEIKRLAEELNLNDYLIFELTRRYVDTKFCNHTPFSRNTLKHFLLLNMGYDARLAETKSGISLILLPFKQMVFARPFLNINDKKYFVFSDVPLNQKDSIYLFLTSRLVPGR